jgi:isocitrate/isopropylmalate dehydrogenase
LLSAWKSGGLALESGVTWLRVRTKAAKQLMSVIEPVTSSGEALSPDLGDTATTHQVTEAIIAAIRGANEKWSTAFER